MAETAAHAASRDALERYATRKINVTQCQAILIANGVTDDPNGTESVSAQLATFWLEQGYSVTDVLTQLGV